jgi:beta-N-acetylhexosaminidase
LQSTSPRASKAATAPRRARQTAAPRRAAAAPSLTTASRLVWGTLRGRHPDADERELLRQGLGGLVLFSRSLGDRDAVRSLVAELRLAARPGLHLAVDQEGGHVVRLRDGFTAFPAAMAIGATGSSKLAFEAARASARELAAAGIDTVLAPVLDLAADLRNPTVGSRAYGADPALVARLGAAAVAGYLAGGVIPVPKHFPGHGRTPLDSHLARPVVAGPMAQLRRDLEPFRAAVRIGAPVLMTSHVRYDALGDDLPATLSAAVTALARGDLGFDGVLLTDAMVMDAITADHAIPEASVAALAAGADIVMALEPARRTIDAIAAAISSGALAANRAADALARVVVLAAEDPRLTSYPPELGDHDLYQHAALAEEIARASLTLAWDDGFLPLAASTRITLVDVGSRAASPVEDAPSGGESPLAAELRRRFGRLEVATCFPRDAAAALATDAALAAAGRADVVLVATRDAFVAPAERQLMERLAAAGKPIVRIALHSPADLALSPRPAVAIAAYSDVAATASALADALGRGPAAFPGRLPVKLPA